MNYIEVSSQSEDKALQKKLAAIAHYFELGSLLSSRRAGGYANTTYFVTTDKGEYVIKWFLPAKLEKLQQELPPLIPNPREYGLLLLNPLSLRIHQQADT